MAVETTDLYSAFAFQPGLVNPNPMMTAVDTSVERTISLDVSSGTETQEYPKPLDDISGSNPKRPRLSNTILSNERLTIIGK